jgi:hypothetical protein
VFLGCADVKKGENYNDENLIVVNTSYTVLIYENEFTKIGDES